MIRAIFYTAFALTAFAFNSILCRLALGTEQADAAGFTAVRLVSGALTLVIIAASMGKTKAAAKSGHWPSAIYLFGYAICFSLAYLHLTAGTGALILFGSVQLTMIAISIARGERPRVLEWIGLATAFGGLVYLTFPGLTSPPLTNSLLMAAAGAAWGLYTLRGKGSKDPLGDTTGNFVRTLPFAAIALVVFLPNLNLTPYGILLACLSGAVASGVGYTIWYAALKHHTPTRAAVLQLSVPVIAALLGMVMLSEPATMRLSIAAALILGGIGLTLLRR